jgi:SAM-dependent methyltransferase
MQTATPSSCLNIPYDANFFDNQAGGSLTSAQVVVPIVMNIVRPKSVIDVGCGVGAWLKVFLENGVKSVLGIDGDYLDRGQLLIDPNQFQAQDLNRPHSLGREFDLAVCLEVGEHLPTRVAPAFVDMLTKAAPLVLFSAAIPGQGGTNHINEQWPSFWKTLFKRHDFVRLDPIRRLVCFNRKVDWWYRQNIFLYASQEALARSVVLREERDWATHADIALVQEGIFADYSSFSGLLRRLPGAAWRAIKNRFTNCR